MKDLDRYRQCWESSFSFQVEQNAIYCIFLGSSKSIKEANRSLPFRRSQLGERVVAKAGLLYLKKKRQILILTPLSYNR